MEDKHCNEENLKSIGKKLKNPMIAQFLNELLSLTTLQHTPEDEFYNKDVKLSGRKPTIADRQNSEIENADKKQKSIKIKGININIGSIILEKIDEKDRTIGWLAKKIDCDPRNLGRRLKDSHSIYKTEDLLKISIALETDFFAYYSTCYFDYFKKNRSGKNYR